MAVKLSQSLKQTQNLMMTPQLQQAIKLLTLTHLEMTNVIAEEMVENPMLEEISDGADEAANEADQKLERLEAQNQEADASTFTEEPLTGKDDFDWDAYIDTYNSNSSAPASLATPDPDDTPNYENMVSKGMTLTEHLEWQLRMEDLVEAELQLALEIIHNVNEDGYLEVSFDELIEKFQMDREDALDVLAMVQRLDPVGCGCETLVDCLLAQARIAEERSPLLEKIIREHLEDLQVKDFDKIAKTLGVSSKQVESTAEILQNFYPKPGRLISPADTQYVVPDIFVVKVGDEFTVQVNDDGVPRLKISKLYQDMLKGGKGDEAHEYVQEKLKAALWLIKSIQNRQATIYKVSKAIVRQQQEFFKKGPKLLKPMILKDIANEIGMHESTVSRVTTNKFMHTPIGTFELKYFFNTGVGGKDGGMDISSEVLKLKIKDMLDKENARRPLSDQKIAELLGRDGINVARRTVAKYREMLGVMSSAKRKLKK